MKRQEVTKGINAILSAIDFISNATDSDETGIGKEMLTELHGLKECLKRDYDKLYQRGIKARVKHILKTRGANPAKH